MPNNPRRKPENAHAARMSNQESVGVVRSAETTNQTESAATEEENHENENSSDESTVENKRSSANQTHRLEK